MKKSLLIAALVAVGALSACKYGEPPKQDKMRMEAQKLEKEGKLEEAAALKKQAQEIDSVEAAAKAASDAAKKAEADAAKAADAAKGDAAKAADAAKAEVKDAAADAKAEVKDAAADAKAEVKDAVKK